MATDRQPLVCVETLLSLQESLDGEKALCRNFVIRYVQMWPGRFERIQAAVANGDDVDAMDSALSLRSSSLMVGATRLGKLTDDLIGLLECRSHVAAGRKLASLRACGNQTAGELTAFCAAGE